MPVTIIHSGNLTDSTIGSLQSQLGGELVQKPNHFRLVQESMPDIDAIRALSSTHKVDINTLPDNFDGSKTGLLITDMDSTLISIECIDEIADFLSIKHQVSEITESAMRGEIDFATSLNRRVGLLKNLPEDTLGHVYDERLTLNPGAETLMLELQKRGVRRALVSGGFTYFTDKLKQRLSLDDTLSNTLEIEAGRLTGKVCGNIVDGKAKAEFLRELADKYGIALENCIAVGDGANDLLMMEIAGIGVAYHAKPKVQEKADMVLNYSGLDAILHILDQ